MAINSSSQVAHQYPNSVAPDATVTLPRLLNQDELCQYLGMSRAWAERARLTGDGPPYRVVGRRAIRYPADELLAWLETRRRRSTSDQ
jgi:predicted DNA-binding transcriptional regulator AlpA